MTLGLIWAQADDGVIGQAGGMPWHLPEDLAHFKAITLGHPVIMGRRTWDSLDPRFRPLPGRRNIVVTRDPAWSADRVETAHSIDDALALAAADSDSDSDSDEVWVIGGAQLYAATLDRADRLEVTEIDEQYPDGDAHAPAIPESWTAAAPGDWLTSRTGLRYRFRTYTR
jgi:dihydrofolate reductase